MTLYYMGAFTPAIWSTIAWTEKFNNGLCTCFLRLCGLKSSRNSSRLKNRRCELSLKAHSHSAIFLRVMTFFNQIAVLQCEQYHWHPYNPFNAMYKNAVALRKNRTVWMALKIQEWVVHPYLRLRFLYTLQRKIAFTFQIAIAKAY